MSVSAPMTWSELRWVIRRIRALVGGIRDFADFHVTPPLGNSVAIAGLSPCCGPVRCTSGRQCLEVDVKMEMFVTRSTRGDTRCAEG